MTSVDLPDLVARVRTPLGDDGERRIVGLVGPPGAGKSTLAARLVDAVGHGTVVPMDGFHRRHAELVRLGLVERKGAPETFEPLLFVAVLRSLRSLWRRRDVYSPGYSRTLHDVVDDEIIVPADEALVVVEGNYLLLDEPPWDRVRPLLDLAVYVDADGERRHRSLIERHIAGGRTLEAAAEFVDRSDEANARIVETTRDRADVTISVG